MGEVPHGIWDFVRRADDRRHEALTPPLQQLEVWITINRLALKERGRRNNRRTTNVLCTSVRIVQSLVEGEILIRSVDASAHLLSGNSSAVDLI